MPSDELHEVRQQAKERGIDRLSAEFVLNGFCDGLKRAKMPGEFGEPATAAEASIEQYAVEEGEDFIPIKLFIQDAEEAVDYSPEQLRELAFNLLAMAEVSEALFERQPRPEEPPERELKSIPGGAVESAESFLRRVEKRAKELYALSDQGEWADLAEPLQRQWINVAAAELRGES